MLSKYFKLKISLSRGQLAQLGQHLLSNPAIQVSSRPKTIFAPWQKILDKFFEISLRNMKDWTKEVDLILSVRAKGLLLPEQIGPSEEVVRVTQ